MNNDLLYWIITFILAGGGAYFGSYLREKGKNYATKEDFEVLLDQVKQTTRETEEIKAEISKTSWVEQKRWDLKCELYFELINTLDGIGDALDALKSCLAKNQEPSPELFQELERQMRAWLSTTGRSHVFVSSDTRKLFYRFGHESEKLAKTLQAPQQPYQYRDCIEPINAIQRLRGETYNEVIARAREDLILKVERSAANEERGA